MEENPFEERDPEDVTMEEWEPMESSWASLQPIDVSRIRLQPATMCAPGDRFEVHLKKGGHYRLCPVTAKTAPYEDSYGQGRKALYVDVFGLGISLRPVLFSKLLVKVPTEK